MKIIYSLAILILITLMVACARNSNSIDSSDLDGASELTLERSYCFGSCPVYRLTVWGDGKLAYFGKDHVKTKGRVLSHVSPEQLRSLIEAFNRASFFELQDSYSNHQVCDLPSASVSLKTILKEKKVYHYLGDAAAPSRLTRLEEEIDEIVGTSQWVKIAPDPEGG